MSAPTPSLDPSGPLELVSARTLFTDAPPGRRNAASVIRVESTGRLLMCFSHVAGVALRNQAALMLTASDDDGESWREPARALRVSGLVLAGDGRARPDRGRQRQGPARADPIDLSLGGTEPMTGWYVASRRPATAATRGPSRRPRSACFPEWTELYGASNPHPLADGRLLWAVMGTPAATSAGTPACVSDPDGDDFRRRRSSPRPTAATTATSTSSASPTGGSWRSSASTRPARACYRTRPTRAGRGRRSGRRRSWARTSSCSGSAPGRSLARTATRTRRAAASASASPRTAARPGARRPAVCGGADARHEPGSVCGYPDLVTLVRRELGAVLHTYPTADGIELHWLRLRDRT